MSGFSKIAEGVRLSNELVGTLCYMHIDANDELGRKYGIFLIRQNPRKGSYGYIPELDKSDEECIDKWWHQDKPFNLPIEEKIRQFHQWGVIWLDDDVLSVYLYVLSIHPDGDIPFTYSDIEEYFYQNVRHSPVATIRAYFSYRAHNNPSTKLLEDYIQATYVDKCFQHILEDLRIRLNFTCSYLLKKYDLLAKIQTGIALVKCAPLEWWACVSIAQWEKDRHIQTTSWEDTTIAEAILGYLAATYWQTNADIHRFERIPTEIRDIKLPVEERIKLWEEYYHQNKKRIANHLNLEDNRCVPATDDEIMEVLLSEELEKRNQPEHAILPYIQDFSKEDADILLTRIQQYEEQCLTHYGWDKGQEQIAGKQNSNSSIEMFEQNQVNEDQIIIPQDCHDAITQVLTDSFSINNVCHISQTALREAAKEVNLSKPPEIAYLMVVGKEVGCIKQSAKVIVFIKALIGLRLMPWIDTQEIGILADKVRKKINGQPKQRIPKLPNKHREWSTKIQPIGEKIYNAYLSIPKKS